MAWFRPIRRLLWWACIISLPVQLPFIFNGVFEGIAYARLSDREFDAGLERFKHDYEGALQMDYYSVPGAPGIHDVGVAPFFVPKLREPTNWWKRLGLKRFDIDPEADPPIDRYASLDGLYRRNRGLADDQHWHHFVFVSAQFFHMSDNFWDQWDEAFDELLRYHYVHPAVGNAGFHYIQGPGNFLCTIWQTRGPALLHFTTEVPEDAEDDRPQVPGHSAVTVRIIELPLPDSGESLLPPGVFPSAFNQMRSVTENPDVWPVHVPYSGVMQWIFRLEDTQKECRRKYPQSYGRSRAVADRLNKMMGFEDGFSLLDLSHFGVLFSTMVTYRGVTLAAGFVGRHVASFFGRAAGQTGGEESSDDDGVDEGEQPVVEDNFMAQMLRDFMNHAKEETGKDVEGILHSSPEGQKILDNMWNIVRRKPEDEDSVGNEKQAVV